MASATVMYRLVGRDEVSKPLGKMGRAMEAATRHTNNLRGALSKVDGKRVRVPVHVDTKKARAQLTAFTRQIDAAGVFANARAYAIGAAIVAGLALAPPAAALAASGIVLALGGAFAAIGVVAAAQNKKVRASFADLRDDVVADAKKISTPFVDTLETIADVAQETWREFSEPLERAFRVLAPAVSRFAEDFGAAFRKLAPAIEPVSEAFADIVGALGPKLKPLFADISDALTNLSKTVSSNENSIADMVAGLLSVIPKTIGFLDKVAKLWLTIRDKAIPAVRDFFGEFDDGAKDIPDAIVKVIKTFGGRFTRRLNKTLNETDWSKVGRTVGTRVIDALSFAGVSAAKITGAVIDVVKRVDWAAVAGAMATAMVSSFGAAFGGVFARGGARLWGWIKDAFSTDSILRFFSPVISIGQALYIIAKEVGKDMIRGFVDALGGDWWKKLLSPFYSFVDTVKTIFGIKSPSTVFRRIGIDVVQGLINGLLAKLAGLRKTAFSLGAAIRNRFKGAGSWLVSRGKQLVQGLISGINSKRSPLNESVTKAVSGVLKRWGRLRNTRHDARFVVNSVMGRLVSRYNQVAKAFDGKTAPVPKYRGGGQVQTGTDPRQLATGGHISGPGTGTSDSILARVSNGEFVVNARQTKKHLDLLRAVNAGADGFANGGLVGGIPWDVDPQRYVKRQNQRILASVNQMGGSAWEKTLKRVPHIIAGLLEKAAKKLGFSGNVGGAMRFARAQDGKPYIWGGVGPGGYDCSGFMSAITNVLQGRHPYSRRFTTASFFGGRGVAGFARGARSAFQVGVNPGSHMAGTLIGGGRRFNVESGGMSGGVNFGPRLTGRSPGPGRTGSGSPRSNRLVAARPGWRAR